ncbi:hypothetical protein RFW50_13410, partial [Acinetobacter baumannii]|nr:hypothetical protein [Acinetobacter baumannii]
MHGQLQDDFLRCYLHSLVEKNSKLHIKELFAAEQDRFQNYSVKFDQLVF